MEGKFSYIDVNVINLAINKGVCGLTKPNTLLRF